MKKVYNAFTRGFPRKVSILGHTGCTFHYRVLVALALTQAAVACVPSSPVTYLDWGLDPVASSTPPGANVTSREVTKNVHAMCGADFHWPVAGNIVREFAGASKSSPNAGIDIQGTPNAPVHASASGTVMHVGYVPGYGNVAILSHEEGLSSIYAGLGAFSVMIGQRVTRGQILGTLPELSTGSTTVLHFEIRRNTVPIDPRERLDNTCTQPLLLDENAAPNMVSRQSRDSQ